MLCTRLTRGIPVIAMIRVTFWLVALCQLLIAMQPVENEYAWAGKLEPIAEKILSSKYFTLATKPTPTDFLWLNFAMLIYQSSQVHVPIINTLSIIDTIVLGAFQNLYPTDRVPYNFTEERITVQSKPTASWLLNFQERTALYLERLRGKLEDRNSENEAIQALIDACQLQIQAIFWAREQGEFTNFGSYVVPQPERLDNIHSFLAKVGTNFSFKSVYSLGVFIRYTFFIEKNDANEAVKSGLYRESNPDVHIALMLHCRYRMKNIVGMQRQDYAPFDVEAILKIFPLAFPTREAGSLNLKGLIVLSETIKLSIANIMSSSTPTNSRFETAHIMACANFVLDEIKWAEDGNLLAMGWVPVVEALAETTILLLPPSTLPKFTTLTKKQKIKLKDIQGLKAILMAAERYNLTKEIQTGRLARIVESFALAFAILEMQISSGKCKTNVISILPFSAYLAMARSVASNRKIDFVKMADEIKAIKDLTVRLGAASLYNPTHPKSLELKKKYKDVYEAIFKELAGPTDQISSKQRDTAVKGLVQEENEKAAASTSKNKRRRAKAKATKLAKRVDEPQIVEVDSETEQEIVTEPVPQANLSLSLVVFDADGEVEDDALESDESSENETMFGALVSLNFEQVETFKSDHVAVLLDRSDRALLKLWDARDIAYSYLIIGNHIYNKFFTQLFVSLTRNYKNLRELFNKSVDDFKNELLNLELRKPALFETILFQAYIKDTDMLCTCLDWYSKRLRITHQYKPLDCEFKHETAGDFVSMLYQTVSGYELAVGIAGVFDIDTEEDLKVFGISASRPHEFPSMETINYDLSVLALYDLLYRSQEGRNYGENELATLRDLRNGIAHSYTHPAHVRSYISHIYKGHPDAQFLQTILTDCTTHLVTYLGVH